MAKRFEDRGYAVFGGEGCLVLAAADKEAVLRTHKLWCDHDGAVKVLLDSVGLKPCSCLTDLFGRASREVDDRLSSEAVGVVNLLKDAGDCRVVEDTNDQDIVGFND